MIDCIFKLFHSFYFKQYSACYWTKVTVFTSPWISVVFLKQHKLFFVIKDCLRPLLLSHPVLRLLESLCNTFNNYCYSEFHASLKAMSSN